MDATSPTIAGWRTRLRLLAADLVTFDPRRLAFALAARTVLGLFLPLLAARLFNAPDLVWMGFGAFLIAIGDSLDDGDRNQARRILTGTALGSLALACGVMAGATLPGAVAGMLLWGVVCGMMGAYGSALATMSLPVAWAYVELGLPALDHSAAHAAKLAALFAGGGLLTLGLTFLLRFGGPFAPARAQAAEAVRQVALYLGGETTRGPVSIESQVRGAIAKARETCTQARGAAQATSHINQRLLMLIEVADRLFSLAGALRESGLSAPTAAPQALALITHALAGHADCARLHALAQDLDAAAAASARSSSDSLRLRTAEEAARAVRLWLDDASPDGAIPGPFGARPLHARDLIAPLLTNLDLRSVVARHALRFAVVTALAVVVLWVFPKPFGYWVPLTVTVVLKPFAGMTLARAVQRICGTVLGLMVGMALTPVLPTAEFQLAAVAIIFFLMMAVLPFNYSLAIFFLSAGLIPFEHALNPALHVDVGLDRLVATGIGAALAVLGGHVLWPAYERRTLPTLLATTLKAMADYADAVLASIERGPDAARMQTERRTAGVALTNLHAGVQRALTEIGGDPTAMSAMLRASTALQRISITLNTLMNVTLVAAPPRSAGLAAFRAMYVSALRDPQDQGTDAAALRQAVHDAPPHDAVAQSLDRLISAREMLGAAVSISPEPRRSSSPQI